MGFEISRREVSNNLIRFKDHLFEQHSLREEQGTINLSRERGKERSYQVLLNCNTGDMRFAQRIREIEGHISGNGKKRENLEDWKQIRIIVQPGAGGQRVHFEARNAKNQLLSPSEMKPIAWRVATETLDVLNLKAEQSSGNEADMLPEEAVLKDLSSIRIAAVPTDRIHSCEGWMGSISRIEAEHILEGLPVGTYLLREGDELTVSISFHFEQENFLEIHPYIATVVEEEGKISDILLLQTSKGWTLYRDDPNLNNRGAYEYFPTLSSLMPNLPLLFPANRPEEQK